MPTTTANPTTTTPISPATTAARMAARSARQARPAGEPTGPIRLTKVQAQTIRVAQHAHADPVPFLGITARAVLDQMTPSTRRVLERLGLVEARTGRTGRQWYRLTRAGLTWTPTTRQQHRQRQAG